MSDEIRWPRHKCGMYLKHNEHKDLYQTVEQWVEDNFGTPGMGYDEDDWVSPEEKQRATETGEVWVLQWYPDTPVGFCVLLASNLNVLLEAANDA